MDLCPPMSQKRDMGHPPQWQGKEDETWATYPESHFQLAGKDQLTLVTDGVAEARSRTGELFGLERTQAIATQSAESIAETAQHFGQDDDITVLTVTRAQEAIHAV